MVTTAKKVCALLMVLTVLLTTGCGTHSETKDDTSSAADIYIEKAQKYVDEKDYAAAIDILQLGMETVDDEALEEMLGEVIELQISDTTEDKTATETEKDAETDTNDNTDTEQQVFDISKYVSTVTYWAAEGTDWVYGGYTLGIYISETSPDNAYFEFSYLQGAPSSRNAVASAEIPLSEITSNEVTFSFENDGWGHSGKVQLIFSDDSISFTVSDVAYTDPSCPEMWGFYDVSGSLVSNPTIYDDLYYTEEEYEALFGEPEYTPQEPTYDTSRASGILTRLEMTEQEFRDSCIFVTDRKYDTVDENIYVTLDDLKAYPSEYENRHFVAISSVYSINMIVRGEMDIADSSVKVNYKYSTDDGYYVYEVPVTPSSSAWWEEEMAEVIIIDFRDNMTSPNITEQDRIVPYMIFRGLHNDVPLFWLISVDVDFD